MNGAGSNAYAYILKEWWNGTPKQGDTFTFIADPNSTVVEMPVLFCPQAVPNRRAGAHELTSDFVNSLINGNTVITGNAYGPQENWSGNGPSDILEDYSNVAFNLAGFQKVIYVDARDYSIDDGFVHCATNVVRVIPGGKRWWEV